MGQGGNVVLVNCTPYDWERTRQQSYQMKNWSFPDVIKSGTCIEVYVEWSEFIGDSGEAEYVLEHYDGTTSMFELQAPSGDIFNIQVYLTNMSTQNNRQGSIIPLGWNRGGCVYFILSGFDNFVSNNPPVDWLHSNLGTLGDRTLHKICMPGTHNSGMSVNTGGATLFGIENITLTQSLSIGEQLRAGARWFDIRPVISGRVFKTGYYRYIDQIRSWQGANGQSISEIINQVNSFTAYHPELIFLKLSHTRDTDAGNSLCPEFSPDQWRLLLKELLGIQHLFVAPNAGTVNLNTLTLNSFIGQGQAAVVVLLESGDVDLSRLLSVEYANKGFYKASQCNMFESYTETDNKDELVKAQLANMKEVSPNSDRLFSLSWTTNLSAAKVGACFAGDQRLILGREKSIKGLAAGLYPELYRQLIKNCNKHTYPNIINIDYMSPNRDIVALAMAVNEFAA